MKNRNNLFECVWRTECQKHKYTSEEGCDCIIIDRFFYKKHLTSQTSRCAELLLFFKEKIRLYKNHLLFYWVNTVFWQAFRVCLGLFESVPVLDFYPKQYATNINTKVQVKFMKNSGSSLQLSLDLLACFKCGESGHSEHKFRFWLEPWRQEH